MNRRYLLGLLAAGGWTAHRLPGSWTAPLVDGVLLPAHAQTSPASLAAAAGPIQEGPLPVARDTAFVLSQSVEHEYPAPGLFADGGFGPDNLGNPAATLVYFGGGSLGGSVTAHAAGDEVELAGGTLSVHEDGSWRLDGPPFTPGSYTFSYRLTNVNGSSDARVRLEIRDTSQPPVASDDLLALRSDTPASGALFADNGTGADDLGNPVATLVSFGGGSLGGAVTDHAAGESANLAGGTLMVDADGSWSLDGAPFTAGSFTFEYRLRNAAGTSDATVTVEIEDVTAPPLAADDTFTVVAGTTLSANVFSDNGSGADKRGNPAASVVSFGDGSLGDDVTAHDAGETVPLANATLTLQANGALTFTGASAQPGTYTFDYRVDNGIGTSEATVTLQVERRIS